MNFVTDVLGKLSPNGRALVELARDDSRREYSFAEVIDLSARVAGKLQQSGVKRGDTVLTLIGNRPEWVLTMVACFRIGAVVLPCNEQLRSGDLVQRLEVITPKLIVADKRNNEQLKAANPACKTLYIQDSDFFSAQPAPVVDLSPTDPCLITFTSGTSGKPQAVLHGQRYLLGQHLQAKQWLATNPGDLVWCTAASGWSKSARNTFIAPWISGAAGLLHDQRFEPDQRLKILEKESVNVLCMAPTEYRVIAKRAKEKLKPLPHLRRLVAAGEALNSEVLDSWQQSTGLPIIDGYGQTETGHITATPLDQQPRPGSMGKPLQGIKAWVEDGELVIDPETVPTFFLNYIGSQAPVGNTWYTGDRVSEDQDGYLYFEGRSDDIIVSSGYRIGPFEVESVLISHKAVTEAAAVSASDTERGSVVKAVVVLSPNFEPSEALKKELQDYVKSATAPYKYPRIVEFTDALPKTTSGKIKRAELKT